MSEHVGTVTFIDNLAEQTREYAELYKLPDTFLWYVIGAAWHTVGMSSSMIPDYLDQMRASYSDMRERLGDKAGNDTARET